MTPIEFAFLALGLVLGVASGAALVVVFRSHPASHEVKVTMAHDAVPRRGTTLSADAFVTYPAEVARGGPADRRAQDRDFPATNDPVEPLAGRGYRTGVPWNPPGSAPAQASTASPARIMPVAPLLRSHVPMATAYADPAIGIRIAPEPDPDLASLRASMAVAAEQAALVGTLTATAVLERPAELDRGDASTDASSAAADDDPGLDESAILKILRGDRRTLLRVVSLLAPADHPVERFRWQHRLDGLLDAIVRRAIVEGMLEIPEGHRFWDPFDRDQTRAILRALAAHGHRPDGSGGWEDDREPNGRQLAAALADAGLDPRRIRPWPIEDHIDGLVTHATVAADQLVREAAPELALEDVQALVEGSSAASLRSAAELWPTWERVRRLLLTPARELGGLRATGVAL